jgi:hydroxyacylglutathione hydrolase
MKTKSSIRFLKHPFRVAVSPGLSLDRFVYSYILFGRTITLIDTGVSGSEKQIFETIRSMGRDPSEIATIILTHSHPDHIGAARAIWKDTGCIIAAHPAERSWIEDVELQNRERPVPGFSSLVSGPVHLDRELSDGDRIDPDGTGLLSLQVFHTPGHSRGSVCLFMPGAGALFSGDVIPVVGDLPVFDDAVASAESIGRLRRLSGIRVLYSAWDEPRTGSDAYRQMDHGLMYLQEVHKAVLANADTASDLMDITKKAAAALRLPPHAVNPLLARTFSANLKARDRKSLID